jgi:hypothetical protein
MRTGIIRQESDRPARKTPGDPAVRQREIVRSTTCARSLHRGAHTVAGAS